jgi:hypothetical protein
MPTGAFPPNGKSVGSAVRTDKIALAVIAKLERGKA